MDDREQLVELLKGSLPHFMNDIAYWQDEHVAELADHLLSHGVTIREPGYWQLCKDDSSDNRTRYYRCSVCKGYRFHNGEMRKKYKHCPNCGSPMTGKE